MFHSGYAKYDWKFRVLMSFEYSCATKYSEGNAVKYY